MPKFLSSRLLGLSGYTLRSLQRPVQEADTKVLEPDGPQDTHRCSAAAFSVHVHDETSTDAMGEVISQADYFERQLKSCDRDFQDLEVGRLAHASTHT